MVTSRIVGGIIGGGLATFLLYRRGSRKEEAASWPPHFTPTVKWDANWDRRDPASCVEPPRDSSPEEQNRYNERVRKAKPAATRHLYLIRHGQYHQRGATDEQCRLTELGKAQAELTGKRLVQLGVPFTKIIHSTMARAAETAEIIHAHMEGLPKEACSLIREGAPIPPVPSVGSWKPENKFREDGTRIEASFRKYFHRAPPSQKEDSYEIIVCHANVIRYWLCRVLQFPPEGWLRFSLANGSITRVCLLPSGRVSVRSVGDTGHFPPHLVTTA